MSKEHQLCVQFENDQSFLDTLRTSWQPEAAERLHAILAGHCGDERAFNNFNRAFFQCITNNVEQFPKLFGANKHRKWIKGWRQSSRDRLASTLEHKALETQITTAEEKVIGAPLKHPRSPSPNDMDISSGDNEEGQIEEPSPGLTRSQRRNLQRKRRKCIDREAAQAAGTYTPPIPHSKGVLNKTVFLQIGTSTTSPAPFHDSTVYSLSHLLSVRKFRLVEWDGK